MATVTGNTVGVRRHAPRDRTYAGPENMAYLAILSATKGAALGLRRRSVSRSACQSSVWRRS